MKPYQFALSGTVLVGLILLVGFGGGSWLAVIVFLVAAAVCLAIGAVVGIEISRTGRAGQLARTERELFEARVKLSVCEETNVSLRRANSKQADQLDAAESRAEGHLREVQRYALGIATLAVELDKLGESGSCRYAAKLLREQFDIPGEVAK
ncbi:hypothetical protein IMZ11_02685 [Microtetraspora sp. AC03309]|uniref:hypothetical protein n=1 Tax=Microtetraspora sp. AC03309 TaxID=2779376 RepID=UPI001E4B35ED|nr:hypothetical protein [Microtetraspora sp. AC03309]MCC5574546.1 hypothetical protein [Microtetraspora sp. AC03309]